MKKLNTETDKVNLYSINTEKGYINVFEDDSYEHISNTTKLRFMCHGILKDVNGNDTTVEMWGNENGRYENRDEAFYIKKHGFDERGIYRNMDISDIDMLRNDNNFLFGKLLIISDHDKYIDEKKLKKNIVLI